MDQNNKQLLEIINGLQPINESEQLDELKASTLGSYIKKASDRADASTRWAEIARDMTHDKGRKKEDKEYYKNQSTTARKNADKRFKGISTAADKLATGNYQESFMDHLAEVLEYLDEDQMDQLADFMLELLEDQEQIDELKASTLGSYLGKSAKSERELDKPADEVHRQFYIKTSKMNDQNEKEKEREKLIKTLSGKQYTDAKRKIDNRRTGWKQAIDKLDRGDYQD